MNKFWKSGIHLVAVVFIAGTAGISHADKIVRPTGNDNWYYVIGGGQSFLGYRQSNRTHIDFGVGADWRMFRGCQFDPRISIRETFTDVEESLYGLADDLVGSARGLILTWGLSKIQEAYPTLYDFLMNGVKDAHQKYLFALKSCRDYQSDLNAKRDPVSGWVAYGKSSSWAQSAQSGENPVKVDKEVDGRAADRGFAWIDGVMRGGRNQQPARVVQDATRKGYQHVTAGGATPPTTPGPVDGAVDLGPDLDNPAMVFTTAEEAQAWTVSVVGEREISTCTDCQKLNTKVGQGLRLKLTEEQNLATQQMRALLTQPSPSLADLDRLSVPGMGLVLTDAMIRRLKSLPPHEADVFASKLVSEIAMMRTMEKALTARDLLAAGMQEPNVAANAQAMEELNYAKGRLDEEMNNLLFETDVRKKVFSQTALTLNSLSTAHQQVAPPVTPPVPGQIKAGAIRNGD
jgi:integrating conjugative element protein (TIGR03755 family)